MTDHTLGQIGGIITILTTAPVFWAAIDTLAMALKGKIVFMLPLR